MKILIEIAQPICVHFYKYIIRDLINKGHEAIIIARDREHTLELLNSYGFEYENISQRKSGMVHLFLEMIIRDLRMIRICKSFKPDLILTRSYCGVHVSKIMGIPSIVDDDDGEAAGYFGVKRYKYASAITTPSSLPEIEKYRNKIIHYNGYKELAYLHPNSFKPDPSIKEQLGINHNERYFVLRFSAYDACHDVGKKGLSNDTKFKIIREMEKYGHVFITAENELIGEFEKYRIPVKPDKIHDILFYADIYAGDSQTMATEAAVLGTPSVRCSPFAGKLPTILELQNKYGLTYEFPVNKQEAFKKKIKELLKIKNLRQEWAAKRKQMLNDKIDVTSFIVKLIDDKKFINKRH